MLVDNDLLCLLVCFIVSSAGGAASLALVFLLSHRQQKELEEKIINNVVSVSGNGNTVKGSNRKDIEKINN